jgi:hypothetical protein
VRVRGRQAQLPAVDELFAPASGLVVLALCPRHGMSICTQQISKNVLVKKKLLKAEVERGEDAENAG